MGMREGGPSYSERPQDVPTMRVFIDVDKTILRAPSNLIQRMTKRGLAPISGVEAGIEAIRQNVTNDEDVLIATTRPPFRHKTTMRSLDAAHLDFLGQQVLHTDTVFRRNPERKIQAILEYSRIYGNPDINVLFDDNGPKIVEGLDVAVMLAAEEFDDDHQDALDQFNSLVFVMFGKPIVDVDEVQKKTGSLNGTLTSDPARGSLAWYDNYDLGVHVPIIAMDSWSYYMTDEILGDVRRAHEERMVRSIVA